MIVVSTKIYCKNKKGKRFRNKYLWANSIIYYDQDDKCPVIEG